VNLNIQNFFLICSSIVLVNASSAETTIEAVSRKAFEAFSGKNCNETQINWNHSMCTKKSALQTSQMDLQKISEASYFNRLAELELDRLSCGQQYWQSLSSADAQNQFISAIDEVAPELNRIQRTINKLVVQTLNIKIPTNVDPRVQLPPQMIQDKKRLEDLRQEIQKLKELKELMVSQIPQSEIPEVRDFIEQYSGPGFFNRDPQKVDAKEFKKMTQNVSDFFKKKINEIKKTKTSYQYDLSGTQREELGTDSYLTGLLMSERPDAMNEISKQQCLAQHRKMGRQGIETAAGVASLVLPVGGFALAKAARFSLLARFPAVARASSGLSKVVSYGAVFVGVSSSAEQIYATCAAQDSASVVGLCVQSPKTILQHQQMGKCVLKAAIQLASGVVGGYIAKKINDPSAEFSKYILSIKDKMNLKAKSVGLENLEKANSLAPQERILATENLIQKSLSDAQKTALLKAHNVDISKLNEKTKILVREGGFTPSEADQIIRTGLAGQFLDSAGRPLKLGSTGALVNEDGTLVYGRLSVDSKGSPIIQTQSSNGYAVSTPYPLNSTSKPNFVQLTEQTPVTWNGQPAIISKMNSNGTVIVEVPHPVNSSQTLKYEVELGDSKLKMDLSNNDFSRLLDQALQQRPLTVSPDAKSSDFINLLNKPASRPGAEDLNRLLNK
jgi:hypothetical protein